MRQKQNKPLNIQVVAGSSRWVWRRRCLVSAEILILTLSSACAGYTSRYYPPDGSRTRVVWNDDELKILPGDTTGECRLRSPGSRAEARRVPVMTVGPGGYWARTFIFVPHAHPLAISGDALVLETTLLPLRVAAVAAKTDGGSGSGGGFSGGGGSGGSYLLAAIAVMIIVASSAIAIGMAAGDPVEEKHVAHAIDEVNRRNDEHRARVAACIRRTRGETL